MGMRERMSDKWRDNEEENEREIEREGWEIGNTKQTHIHANIQRNSMRANSLVPEHLEA